MSPKHFRIIFFLDISWFFISLSAIYNYLVAQLIKTHKNTSQHPTPSFYFISISDGKNGLRCGWAAEQRRGPQMSLRPPFYTAQGSGHFRAHHSAAVAALVLTFTEAWTGSRASRRRLGWGGRREEWKIKQRKEGFGDRVMLSDQGYRLCHLHKGPIHGWRGRSSEDKFSTLGHPNSQHPWATPPLPNQR